MTAGDKKRAAKRAERARRKGPKKTMGGKVMVINDRKVIAVSREGDREWLRFNAKGNV